MPRSGTTLCEQILCSHSKVDGAGELTYLAEMSGINQIISPDNISLDKFEMWLTTNLHSKNKK